MLGPKRREGAGRLHRHPQTTCCLYVDGSLRYRNGSPQLAIQPSARMNVPDEIVLGSASDRQTADSHGDGQHLPSVRQAAEALFKPTIDAPPPTDEPSHRKPRILPASPAVPARAEADTLAIPQTKRQIGSGGEDATEIPTSEYGRVRVLAEYGMTLRQVAELYAVPLSEVARIVRT